MSDSPTSRKRSPPPAATPSTKRPRKSPKSKTPKSTGDKASKGLRHFSMKVCRKVEEKGHTTYNEVADELVKEVMAEREELDEPRGKYDEKNIRRRVYDALNVLMAMDIISKEKKEIRWKGLPSNAHHDLDMLQREGQFRRAEVERKRESLRELIVQQVCFRNLMEYNRNREPAAGEEKIPLPFIVVNTHSSAVIQCKMSPDRTDVMFDFSMPFEINDDNTILKRLGMDKTTMSALEEMLPRDLLQYCKDHRLLDSVLTDEHPQEPQEFAYHPHQQPAYGAPPPAQQHFPQPPPQQQPAQPQTYRMPPVEFQQARMPGPFHNNNHSNNNMYGPM